jgi:hypothetical protein
LRISRDKITHTRHVIQKFFAQTAQKESVASFTVGRLINDGELNGKIPNPSRDFSFRTLIKKSGPTRATQYEAASVYLRLM